MDTLVHYRQLIQQILLEYARIPCAHGGIKCEAGLTRNGTITS
jgi:hypothetical protein